IVPAAELSINDEAKRIVAWATPAEQETINSSLDELRVERAPEEVPQLEVFRLTKVDPTSTLTLLDTLLPDARLAVDLQTKTLIALGSPADLKVIRNTLKTLQPDKPGPDAPELRFYELALAMPPSFLDIMQKVAPESQVVMDATGNRLMVVATPADHAKIEKTIESVKKKEFMEGLSKLQIYPVTPSQRKRFEAVMESLTTQLPGIKVITDAQPGELAVWAKPQQHEVLVGILAELRRDVPAEEKYLLAAYPVASADPTSVLTMLQELFPDTKLVLDAKGKRLLAWTSAAEHESIKASLEQIESGGPPTVEVYPLVQADLTSTMTLLSTLVPEAQLTPGAKGDTLIARAVAADHETIKATLQKLDPEEPGPNTPQLQFYPFEKDPPASLITILTNLAPKAQITADPDEKRLFVMATPSDHKTIQATIERFKEATPDSEPQLVVYPVKSIDSTSVLTLLTTLVPEAQLTVEAQTGNLVALAFADEHQIIKDALDQLQPETPGPDTPVLRFHALTQDLPADILPALQKLVPKAQMTADAQNKRLMAVASPEDHKKIESTVREFEANTPPEEPSKLVVYAVTPQERKRFDLLQPTLVAEMPGMTLIGGAEPGELAIWAKPTEHLVLSEIVEQLKSQVPDEEKRKLVGYRIKSADPDSVLQMLQKLYPDTEFVLDLKANRLLVWTRAEEHDSLKASLEEIETASLPEERPRFEAFPIYTTDATTIPTTLQPLVPNARFTVDVKTKRLIAWGTPAELEIIRTAVENLRQGVFGKTAENTPTLEVYRLKKADPQATLTLLQGLVPDAEFTLDTLGGRLIALAVPADHETIKSTVEKVEAEGPEEERPRFETYPIYGADVATGGTTFLTALQPLVPNARLTVDVKNKKLVAWGTPEEQAIIRKAVESLLQRGRGGGTAETTPQLEVYPLTKADPTSTLTLLQSLVPDAQLNIDPQTNSLVALAVAADQKTIKATVDRLEPDGAGPNTPVLRFHPLTQEPPAELATVLLGLVPKAQITLDTENDRVMAVATPADHEIIKSTIEEYEAGTPPDEPNRLIVYSVTARERKRFEALLPTLLQELPGAEIIGEAEPGEMAVWAKPTQHLVIAGIVEELKGGAPGDGQFRLGVYPIKSAAPQSVLTVLQKLFPGTEFVLDERTKRLMAWTSPGEQQKIKSALDEMDSGVPGELQEELVVYPVPDLDPQIAVQMLQALVTDVQFSTDTTAGTILAWGRKSDHAIIAKTLQQMSEKGPPTMAPTAAVYTLESITPTSAMQILALAVPKAKLTPGPGADQFVAWARPQDHQVIQSTLENI
ncbi:MAG: hypothetical protein ABIK89_08920, partial [Planctomycetota bacterium]